MTTKFAHLSHRTIAVDLEINGRQVSLRGEAIYEELPGAGPVLRIHVADPAGDFDILLDEERFDGQITPDERPDVDYRVNLHQSALCVRT